MGTVYEAHDLERDLSVALKTLTNVAASDLSRFKREFRALADISHPNIVTLYELVATDGQWFFTMELVSGQDFVAHVRPIGDRLRTGGSGSAAGSLCATQSLPTDTQTASLPTVGEFADGTVGGGGERRRRVPEQLADPPDYELLGPALGQLAGAVAALHELGMVHRDLKPSNILVTPGGRVVVMDFGIVAELGPQGVDRRAIGTPAYAAPEQAAGAAPTPAADWYSFGVLLYRCLTGQVPYRGTRSEVLAAKQKQDAPRPSEVAREVPAELDGLCAALMARNPGDRPAAAEILDRLGARSSDTKTLAVPGASGEAAVYVGREQELASLQEALDVARQGETLAVTVVGESGIGKSSLVHQYLDRCQATSAERGLIVLRGRCHQRETLPYKGIDRAVDMLAHLLEGLPAEQVSELMPVDAPLLGRIFPVLRRLPGVGRDVLAASLDAQELRVRAFLALRELLVQLAAGRPVVLFIDDLQWVDRDSVELLQALVRAPGMPGLLLITAARTENLEADPALAELHETMSQWCTCRRLELERLTDGEHDRLVIELFGASAPSRETLNKLRLESRGSPLLAHELLRYTRAGGAVDDGLEIADLLLDRLERLPQDARALLEVTAVAGEELPLSRLGPAAELPAARRERAFVQLRSAALLRVARHGKRPWVAAYHHRVFETILGRMSSARRTQLHRQLATTLDGWDCARAESLARHWSGAGEGSRAAAYWLDAASGAEEQLAFDRAGRYYLLSLESGQHDDGERRAILARLGQAKANAGDLQHAARAFGQAAADDSSPAGTELRRKQVEALLRIGDLDQGLALAEQLFAEVGVALPQSRPRVLAELAMHRLWVAARGIDFVHRDPREIDPADLLRLDVFFSVASGFALVDPMLGIAVQTRQLRCALRVGDPLRASLALCCEIGYRGLAGQKGAKALARVADMGQRLADDQGPAASGCAMIVRGQAAFIAGDFQSCYQLCTVGEGKVRDHAGFRWQTAYAILYRTSAMVYLGRFRELAQSIPVLARRATEQGDFYLSSGLRSWRSNVAWLVMDEPEQARSQVDEATSHLPKDRFLLAHYYAVLAHTQIDLYLGDGPAAWRRLTAAWPAFHKSMLSRAQSVRIESQFLRARCALAVAVQCTDDGEQAARLKEAARAARAIDKDKASWGQALAGLVRGGIHALQGDNAAAIDELSHAADGFEQSHMVGFRAVARLRMGELRGDAEGRDLVAQETEWLAGEGVLDPDALCFMHAPASRR